MVPINNIYYEDEWITNLQSSEEQRYIILKTLKFICLIIYLS